MKITWMVMAGLVVITGGLLAGPVQASSDAAWQQQRQTLASRCLAAAKRQQPGRVVVTADPFGSQSYAMAVVTRTSTGRNGVTSRNNLICVMDKRSGKVELGGELPALPSRR